MWPEMVKIPACKSCGAQLWRRETGINGTMIDVLDPSTGRWAREDIEGDEQPDVSFFCDNCGKSPTGRTEEVISEFPEG
jgi:predicted RNA-binding Zn-ribbon protein involved in translation (DUF1610 family)